MTDIQLDLEATRRVLATAQGLGASSPGESLADQVARTGYVRTLGGVDVYLGLRARRQALTAREVHADVEKLALQVVPTVRGCMYLVPRSEVPWSLRIADLLSAKRRVREHEKAGIDEGEVESLADVIVATLGENGPSTTDALRRSLPGDAIRSLGDAGKKVGISSTLPPALRHAEFSGLIERTLDGGRLDSERYLWRVAKDNPFEGSGVPDDPAGVHRHFAQLFVRNAGLANVDRFAAWSGLGKRDARTALEAGDHVEVEAEGFDGLQLASRAVLDRADATDDGFVSFLPGEDNLIQLCGGASVVVDKEFHDYQVPYWANARKMEPLGSIKHLGFRPIAVGARLVGFWEYDPDTQDIATSFLDAPRGVTAQRLESERQACAVFLRDQIGHGRNFSIAKDDDLRRRVERLAELG